MMNEIKKIPKNLYGFLCSSSIFDIKDGDYSKIIKNYSLNAGTLLYSKKTSIDVGFIGHRHRYKLNRDTEEFLLWPSIPEGWRNNSETEIDLKIICGDISYRHGDSFYERKGIYIDFRPQIKLKKDTNASIFSLIFGWMENYLEKNNA